MNVYHCGRCGKLVNPSPLRSGARWFHLLDSKAVYDDPDGMAWAIGHDADPLPGPPTDRRTGVLPGGEPKDVHGVFVDDEGYLVEPVSYEL